MECSSSIVFWKSSSVWLYISSAKMFVFRKYRAGEGAKMGGKLPRAVLTGPQWSNLYLCANLEESSNVVIDIPQVVLRWLTFSRAWKSKESFLSSRKRDSASMGLSSSEVSCVSETESVKLELLDFSRIKSASVLLDVKPINAQREESFIALTLALNFSIKDDRYG